MKGHHFKAPFIIAIDGPAASGKGTLARQIAHHYHLRYLDTGLTYRAVAYAILQQDLALDDENVAVNIAKTVDLSTLDPAVLASHHIGNAASKIAVMPNLRKVLVNAQQEFSRQWVDPYLGNILDGRDIGTVVCPNADIKFYIIASVEARALRRYKEEHSKNNAVDYETIFQDIQNRDARDMNRKEGPLMPSKDAHLLDTTKLSIEAAFNASKALIDPVFQTFKSNNIEM